jgi:hypothetical protein
MSKISLSVTGLGPVPSFKNSKMICGLKRINHNLWKGQPFLITNPKKKDFMEKAINQLEFQLRGLFPINEGETHGEWQKRLQTASWQLSDDSLHHMLPGPQNVRFVNKGQEGAEITIEPI